LLERSGIGQPQVLAGAGVAVRHALMGVGENLQDHLQIRMAFKVRHVKTLNTLANSWLGKAQIGLEYLLRRSGPMSMAPSQLGAFARSSAAHARPNVQYHVQPLSLDAFGQPLHSFDAFTASVCNLRPVSRGSVHIDHAVPEAAPRIVPNYLAAREDRQVAAESITLTRHIAAQAALAKYQPEEFKPGMHVQGEEALAKAAGDIGTTIFHPVGTCKMGAASDPQAVVDAQGRVHGIGGLRVADASIMPTITSGNTNAPTLMIAEKIAAAIAGRF
jgi:choline dehydrogenase